MRKQDLERAKELVSKIQSYEALSEATHGEIGVTSYGRGGSREYCVSFPADSSEGEIIRGLVSKRLKKLEAELADI